MRHVNKHRSLLAGLAGTVILLAACGDDDTEPADATASVEGKTFLSVGSDNFEIVEGSTIRLTFQDGSIGAVAGCNNMGGSYVITDGVLEVGELVQTEMACAEALMDQDMRLAAFLTSSPEVTVDGDDLTLEGSDSSIDFQNREVVDPDRPLQGTIWNVTGSTSPDAVSSVPEGASIRITDDTVKVDTGCNTGSGSATVDGDTITFGPIALTKKACDEALTELENQVLTVLDGEVSYDIQASSMTLLNGDEGLQLTASS
jgi:heat shock protein HslJ